MSVYSECLDCEGFVSGKSDMIIPDKLPACFTEAVQEAFVQLHQKGLVYHGSYLVNWSPNLQTAVSDLEVHAHPDLVPASSPSLDNASSLLACHRHAGI